MEMDDVFIGGRRSGGKYGWGAEGKTPILMAVESRGKKAGFIAIEAVSSVCSEQGQRFTKRRLLPHQLFRTDGLAALRVLAATQHRDGRPTPPEQAGEWLPWVHISISNLKASVGHVPRGLRPVSAGISHRSSSTGLTGASGKRSSPCVCSAHVWTIDPSDLRLRKVKGCNGCLPLQDRQRGVSEVSPRLDRTASKCQSGNLSTRRSKRTRHAGYNIRIGFGKEAFFMKKIEMHLLGSRTGSQWAVSAELADLTRHTRRVRRLEILALPKRIVFDLSKTALLIVDMQNDFCSPGGWLDYIGVDYRLARQPIKQLQAMIPALRSVGVPVIWVNWGNRPDLLNISPSHLYVYNPNGDSVGLGDSVSATGGKVLEVGSFGAAIVDELSPTCGDIYVRKYRMSGFWDTELDSILRNLDVKTCLVSGVNADQCVLHTLADANFLGYDTVLVEDCTATTSPEYCLQATLYNVRQIFGFTAYSSDIIRALEVS